VTCAACNGESEGGEDGDSSSGGGTSGGGTSGGGTSGGGTSGTGNGGSSSGTGGSNSVDCSGAFGTTRRTVLELPDSSYSGLTVSPDELELIYSSGSVSTGTSQGFFSARRASKADSFTNPVPLPELDAACTSADQTRTGDLSFDGLRFYFTCYPSSVASVTPLRIARRTSLDAPFVVDPTPLGNVLGGPSVSRDELELFASIADEPLARYARNSPSEPFGTGEPLPGFEMLSIATPEIAPNDLDLFISQRAPTGATYSLMMATRSERGAAFATPELILPAAEYEIFGSAALSNDCRSLYYVYILSMPQPTVYRVEVISR
jgi:hypothetical protein